MLSRRSLSIALLTGLACPCIPRVRAATGAEVAAAARGHGGQIIATHPACAPAVAITSDPDQPGRSAGYFGDLLGFLDDPVLDLGSDPGFASRLPGW